MVYKYRSLKLTGKSNYICTLMMVNKEIEKRLGKERQAASTEEFRAVLDNPEIFAANNRSAIVPKQACDRAMALGPSPATKNDLHEADIALCFGAENASNRVDLAHQRGAMGGELGIAVSEKVLPAASAR